MEDFIAGIYNDAFIIEYFKEFISLSNSFHTLAARNIYNKATQMLEELLLRISSVNPFLATRLQDIALNAKQSFDDPCLVKGIVSDQLIPELYAYINNYSGIDVQDNNFRLLSSKTGFLTLYDENKHIYMHDTYDPMWEAYEKAQGLYRYDTDNFLILGSGLGYLAYQIYRLSYGSTKIYIYEDDKTVLDYALKYGVLSLIPRVNLEIIYSNDIELLISDFIHEIHNLSLIAFSVSPWKKTRFNTLYEKELNRLIINQEFDLETENLSVINLRMNRRLESMGFTEAINQHRYTEWVIISAGPSLDDSISFLRESIGKRGLIAVNTVLKRLINENILPDIVVAADQSNDLEKHILDIEKHTKDILLIGDWLLNWKYTSKYLGPICFVRTNASEELTNNSNPNDPVWNVSGTVACLGVETAVRLNAAKIYLVGQDLAYPSGKKYADGMPHDEAPDAKWTVRVPSVNGDMVDTCEAFDWFRKSLETQIEKHRNIDFINMSKYGAYIKGTVLIQPAE